MDGRELISSEMWGLIYEECWRMWKVGLDLMRKATNGMEAAAAKQQMKDAEDTLRIPVRLKVPWNEGGKEEYAGKLKGREEKELKAVFMEGVTGEGKGNRNG